MPKTKRVILVSGLCAALIAAGSLAGCRKNPKKKAPRPSVKSVEIVVVKNIDLKTHITAQGKAQAWQEAKLAAEVTGVIKKFFVDRGDKVFVNKPVVQLVDDNYKRRVRERQAQVLRAKAALSLAVKQHRRHRRLLRSKVLAKSSHDETQANYLRATADLQLTKVALEQAEYDLKKTTLIAPFSGVVLLRYREPGEMITAGVVLLHIANYSKIKIEIGLTEDQVVQIKKGQTATVAFDALPGRTFKAMIDVVGVSADADAGTFPVRIALDNQKRLIRPGMIARVRTRGRTVKSVLLAPAEAVIEQFGQAYVFHIVGNKAVRASVVLGRAFGEKRRIVKGLKPGDKLVVVGQSQLRPGLKVKIVKVHQ